MLAELSLACCRRRDEVFEYFVIIRVGSEWFHEAALKMHMKYPRGWVKREMADPNKRRRAWIFTATPHAAKSDERALPLTPPTPHL